jgi:transposase
MESTMTLYIGIDFHPYQHTVAFCDDLDGVIKYRQFLHSDKKSIKQFYRICSSETVLGVEATGSLEWFQKLLRSLNLNLKVGNPRLIRRMASSQHKNDFRDAENILELLMFGNFPEIKPRSQKSSLILQMLRLRHSLVKQRTVLCNQLQSVARNKGLNRFRMRNKSAKQILLEQIGSEAESSLVTTRFHLLETLDAEIEKLEKLLTAEVADDKQVQLLRTHPGVGELTAPCIVHTLGDVNRFYRKEEVVSFAGLDPVEKSSGERKQFGSISKSGSRLLRFLLVQAGQTTSDKRLKEHYQRVCRRNRAKAKVAVARKLLINCYIMLRDEISYEEFRRRGEVGLCEETRKLKVG